MLRYLQLNRSFDPQAMQAEVAALEQARWKEHYNTRHYEGSWSVIPLRSVNGQTDNIISIHTAANENLVYADTVLLDACPYLRTVIEAFPFEKTSVRLMKLDAGAVIKEHCDEDLSYEEGEIRLHIPVQTNAGVEFYVDNERVIMTEGSCWYLNLSLPHRVSNTGDAPRVHLVIDGLVNEWVHRVFAEEALVRKETAARKPKSYRPEDKQQIIEQLKQMNTPVSLEMAAKMEQEDD